MEKFSASHISDAKEKEANYRDWANPGTDVLETISQRLGPVEHLKFSGACHPWRSVGLTRCNCRSPPPPQFALLMYPTFALSFHRRFINPSNGRRYTFTLSELFADTCIGSAGNWLNMWGIHQYLYNPSTLAKIKLHARVYGSFLASKYVALSNPTSSTFSVISWYSCHTSFLYMRPNDDKWSSFKFQEGFWGPSIIQVIGLKGEFYALTSQGRLAHINLDRNPKLIWEDDLGKVPFDEIKEHAYLVETDEKLMVVITTCRLNKQHGGSQQCSIYTMNEERTAWVHTEQTMRNKVLYLGKKGSICVESGAEAGLGGRVYTAGKSSYGTFELHSSKGILCCDHDKLPNAAWVLPELIVRDREPKWWVALHNINEHLIWRILLALATLVTLAMFVPLGDYFAGFFFILALALMFWFTYKVM